jgi:hypothetical protein
MESDLKTTEPEEIQEENDGLKKAHLAGVFGRSEYANKEFWNDRFRQ